MPPDTAKNGLIKEAIAVALPTMLVLGFLAIRPVEKLLKLCRDTEVHPKFDTASIIGILTLFVLIFQAYIFYRQASIANKQAEIADKQATLNHQTYLTSNRPRLRVRNVVVYKTRYGSRDDSASLFEDNKILGQCFVSNLGNTRAKILESHLIAFQNQMDLPMARPYEGVVPNNPLIAEINAGQSRAMPFDVTNPLTAGEPGRVWSGEHPFFIMGWVAYEDDQGILRRTTFCRKWHARKRRFTVLENDSDYELEE